jgi:thiamine biosynthesis lipoprotein
MVGGQSFSRVIDPRTGWPVTHTTSVSVVASDAMTADVLSTTLGVLAPVEALSRAEEEGWACLLLGSDGVERMSSAWPATDRHSTSEDELEPETSRSD